MYVNTVMLAASILLSGNNFSKTSLWSRCLNLGFISSSTFDRIQKLYAIPAVQSFWSDMKTVVHEVMKKKRLSSPVMVGMILLGSQLSIVCIP